MTNWPSNTSRSLSCVRMMRFLALEIGALLASILLIIVIGGIAASIAGHVYDIKHAIPNPVTRGDDMGVGLVMAIAALGSLLVSLPGAVLIHVYAFKIFFSKGANK